MMKTIFVLSLCLAIAFAAPALKGDDEDNDSGFGNGPYGGSFYQPPPYSGMPAPVWSPNSQFNPYNPVYNPYHPAAYPLSNPMHPSWGHPGFNPAHPLNNPWHPANAFPGFPSYEQQSAETPSFLEAHAEAQTQNHAQGPSDDDSEAAPSPFADIQTNWQNYFAGPTSQFQWPGAEEARPGVHPTLGGTLNPFSPLGNPSHPYPFPMHQGLKNGPNHPRPFTPLGEYYPGTTSLPFAPQFGLTGAFNPFFAPPPYFPGARNGAMNAALETDENTSNQAALEVDSHPMVAKKPVAVKPAVHHEAAKHVAAKPAVHHEAAKHVAAKPAFHHEAAKHVAAKPAFHHEAAKHVAAKPAHHEAVKPAKSAFKPLAAKHH